MTDIKLKLTREQQLDNECIKAWELYRLEKAARERAEAALQAQQQGAQVMELVDLSTALARVRARASESGTAKQHGPQFAAGLRAAANMLEGMRIAQPPSTPEPSDEDFERLRSEVARLNRILGRIVEWRGESTTRIRTDPDAFAAAREYLRERIGGAR